MIDLLQRGRDLTRPLVQEGCLSVMSGVDALGEHVHLGALGTTLKRTALRVAMASTLEGQQLSADLLDKVDFGSNAILRGEILSFTDESFADAENLVRENKPPFTLGEFNEKRGQVFQTWETARHSKAGKEEAVIKLATSASFELFDIDTMWHDGNEAQAAQVLGTNDEGVTWEPLTEITPLQGHSRNLVKTTNTRAFSQIKLVMYPDGGIARLRGYSIVPEELPLSNSVTSFRHPEKIVKADKEPFVGPTEEKVRIKRESTADDEVVSLTDSARGAKVVQSSNERYSRAGHALKVGTPPKDMGDGWEMARYRLPLKDLTEGGYDKIWDHYEWITIELADRAVLEDIEVDFRFFNFNNPQFMQVEGLDLSLGEPLDQVPKERWQTVVGKTDTKQYRSKPRGGDEPVMLPVTGERGPFTHLRVKVFPCGGVHRINARGRRAPLA